MKKSLTNAAGPAQSSSGVVIALVLFGVISVSALGLAIWGVVGGHETDEDTSNLTTQVTGLRASVRTLQVQLLQTQILLNMTIAAGTTPNATVISEEFPAAAVLFDSFLLDGNGIAFHTLYNVGWNMVEWASVLWDDASYWDPLNPSNLYIRETGRYQIGVACPYVGALDGYTASGHMYLLFYQTVGGIACPYTLASAVINGTAPDTGVPFVQQSVEPGYAVTMYVEAELQGSLTGNSAIGLAFMVDYTPSVNYAGPPIQAYDRCEFSIRFVGPARNTPIPAPTCVK